MILNPAKTLFYITQVLLISFAILVILPFFISEHDEENGNEILISKPTEGQSFHDFNEDIFKSYTPKSKIYLDHIKDNLIFYGALHRPQEKAKLFFSIKNTPPFSLLDGDSMIVNNSFILEANLQNDNAFITLHKDDMSTDFFLEKTEAPLLFPFKIADFCVDTNFLKNIKAKFVGIDAFVLKHENHDGKIYRLDIDKTSLYIKEGMVFYYEKGLWINLKDPKRALLCPIMKIDKIDEKGVLITFIAANCPQKQTIHLAKIPSYILPPKAQNAFCYLGCRNSFEWLFEVDGKKVCIKEGDWWLYTNVGWKLLDTEEDIDNYFEKNLTGELFVVDEVEKTDKGQILKGHAFNALRTHELPVNIPLKPKKKLQTMQNKSLPYNESLEHRGDEEYEY
jgi:hypothetical protein